MDMPISAKEKEPMKIKMHLVFRWKKINHGCKILNFDHDSHPSSFHNEDTMTIND